MIFDEAAKLLTRLRAARRIPARLLSVSLSQISGADTEEQLGLFDDAGDALETERDRRLAQAVDAVRRKFGSRAVERGG